MGWAERAINLAQWFTDNGHNNSPGTAVTTNNNNWGMGQWNQRQRHRAMLTGTVCTRGKVMATGAAGNTAINRGNYRTTVHSEFGVNVNRAQGNGAGTRPRRNQGVVRPKRQSGRRGTAGWFRRHNAINK